MQNLNLRSPLFPINPTMRPVSLPDNPILIPARPIQQDDNIVGAYTDEHGCRPSAGYTWCPKENRCVRIWELAKDMNLNNNEAIVYCNYPETSKQAEHSVQQKTISSSNKVKSFWTKHRMLIYIILSIVVLLVLIIVFFSIFRHKSVSNRFSRKRR
jgi:hypothetical protein